MRKRLVWFWSWCCWLAVIALPCRFTSTRLGHALLPWAGLYGYTDGGWSEFRQRADY